MMRFTELVEERNKKEDMRTLYVHRRVMNAGDIHDWAKAQGFKTVVEPAELHVTIMFSKEKVNWNDFTPDKDIVGIRGGKRLVKPLGDDGAVVLRFDSEILQARWKHLRKKGCSWDYPSYQPHVTITYDGGEDMDLLSLEPYSGVILLESEQFKEINPKWKSKVEEI